MATANQQFNKAIHVTSFWSIEILTKMEPGSVSCQLSANDLFNPLGNPFLQRGLDSQQKFYPGHCKHA